MPSVHPKRQRTDAAAPSKALTKPNATPAAAARPSHSRLLAPFRSIGHTTSATPFTLLPQGKTFQLTTALTHTLQSYDTRKLHLQFVSSPPTPGVITRVVAHRDVVYAAFSYADGSPGVWVFRRGKKVGELEGLGEGEGGRYGAWVELIVFGEWVVGALDRGLVVWRRDGGECYTVIEVEGTVALVHPSAFLNKVVVGRRNGDVEVWNVKTGKNIYTILAPIPDGAITTIVQTPVIALLAIGYATGEIHLHNIHTDTPLFTLNRAVLAASGHTKRVTSLSFSTDPFVGSGVARNPADSGRILAVGHDDGFVSLWNLEKRKLFGELRHAHEAAPTGVHAQWLPGQNILVTSAADNSVKQWIFDTPHTARPRLLLARAGHAAAISALSFAAAGTSQFLLSASRDRSLRGASLRNDAASFEFSQGAAVKKAKAAAKTSSTAKDIGDAPGEAAKGGAITCLATCAGDDGAGSTGREWEGIITGHQGERAARTWSFQNSSVGRWTLPTTDGGEVKAVAISACGTFGIVGSASGGIDLFNLQSGLHRRRFPDPLTPAQAKLHTGAVTGVAADALNRVVISCGLDGRVKFWEFLTGILVFEFNWSGTAKTPNKLRLHRPSELLAVSCDDGAIRVIDIGTRKLVRELWGAEGHISDFAFSHDARWIVAASMDACVRIWDVPTGHLVDALRTPRIVSALAWTGPGDEFLATAHVGSVGISLWTNRTLFRHVVARNMDAGAVVDLALPTVSGEGGTALIDAAMAAEDDAEEDATGVYHTAAQLSDSLQTLSLLPMTRWQTLLNLDLIRARNKPVEAPKAPEKAPFFLPTLTNPADPTAFSIVAPAADATAADATAVAVRPRFSRGTADIGAESAFSRELHAGPQNRLVDTLKTLSPSAADREIRALADEDEMVALVAALTQRLRERKDFEVVQTWMAVFLRVHGSAVIDGPEDLGGASSGGAWEGIDESGDGDEEMDGQGKKQQPGERLREALRQWREVQSGEMERLGARVGFCLGVAEFLRSGR
ncbi:Utp21 specific WD40 associated putative domain-containing protein [Geopyxis carbonaria]|nr:Utp21 specific WD40 associated putative domain-containing protein [Geopyxis carbonaria]